MIKTRLKSNFWLVLFIGLTTVGGADDYKSVSLNLLNKTSAKKHPITIPFGNAYVIQDIRIVPRSCTIRENPLSKEKIATVKIDVYLEQEAEEDRPGNSEESLILLYTGDISNNSRRPSRPLEHPIYDIMLTGCE